MFIHRDLRIAVMSVSLTALAGCGSLGNAMTFLSSEQAAKVREECGLIPSKSRVKNAVDPRRRAYLECKRNVLEEEADHQPRP
ncbi:hypothetical protein [Hyphomonas sp.]|jgi:ribosomal protein S30|uniref:hypothetical protein n=1 Tax=Hyphomonas sp. TaxID=87 RepID=UPI0025C340B5|nr:hypothetical protein [Hyphomonas sp.]MEE2878855.1 hypothetical protein [Pseudomonadota bacterium]